MAEFEAGRLIYLLVLLAAIGSYVIVQYRGRLGQAAQQAALWVLIIVGLTAAIGLFDDIKRDASQQAVFSENGRIEVPRGLDGHYHLTLTVNGTPLNFVVDTGATDIVLSRDDAQRVGIDADDLPYFGRANTANGTVQTALVTLDTVTLGTYTDRRVSARVNGGDMQGSLLGMRYLERFERLEISGDRLTLYR